MVAVQAGRVPATSVYFLVAPPALVRRHVLALVALALALTVAAPGSGRAAGPEGQLTWGVHISLAPTWFDPAETPGIITPFMVLYALHDAMVKPMPGQPLAPSLAKSWSASDDGLDLRVRAAQGREVPQRRAGDGRGREVLVRALSRRRQQGAQGPGRRGRDPRSAARPLQAQAAVARLHDLLCERHGAGWIVPKKYVEKVGDEGFKKAPIGAGPYKFVSFTPGVELILEAFDQYWRKTPSVKRLVFKVIPDESTRLAALKRGEVDIVYSIRGELAEELQRTKGLTLKPTVIQAPFWLYFPDQWDPKSPWHDQRVRLAASLAIDRKTINQALTLGHSKLTGSIVPDSFEYYWQPPAPVYDPAKAKKLLAEAGYPNGFDAGDYYCDTHLLQPRPRP